jgi:hypothetical protein
VSLADFKLWRSWRTASGARCYVYRLAARPRLERHEMRRGRRLLAEHFEIEGRRFESFEAAEEAASA